MKTYVKWAALVGVAGLAAACDRSPYESAPVTLNDDEGTVVCQLYTPERVMWDQAIQHSDSLTKEQADAICQAEGLRQKKALRKRS